MIEELQKDSWLLAQPSRPFGRGMNLQLECSDVEVVSDRVLGADMSYIAAWRTPGTRPTKDGAGKRIHRDAYLFVSAACR
jgi:hypothetical protein